MSNFQKEQKYLVVKWEDINRYISDYWRELLESCLVQVDNGRATENKKPNNYVVINEDEPYIETIWKALENGENAKYKEASEILALPNLPENMKKLAMFDEVVRALVELKNDYPLRNHNWWEYPTLKRAHNILTKVTELIEGEEWLDLMAKMII